MRKYFSLDVSDDTSVLNARPDTGLSFLSLADTKVGWAQSVAYVPQTHMTGAAIFPKAPALAMASDIMADNTIAEPINRTGSSNVATVAKSGNNDIDGVLTGSKWTSPTITFSFPATAADYGATYSQANRLPGFQVFNAAQQAGARYALGLIASYTGLIFVETTATNATLRYSQTSLGSVGSADAVGPANQDNGGDVWFGTSTDQPFYLTPQIGNWGMATILHETGHALGLKHGHEGSVTLPSDHDGWDWSLMTYRSDPTNTALSFEGEEFNQPQTYMQDDIAALQYIYGANFNFNAGNTTYSFNSLTREMSIDGVGQGRPTGHKVSRTIWDGNGTDTYDFSNFGNNQTIDLEPGAFSTFSTAALVDHQAASGGTAIAIGNIANALLYNGDLRSLIENAVTGSGNDVISGNVAANNLNGGSGADTISGKAGNDTLIGGTGDDSLAGGTGDDLYIVDSLADAVLEVAGEGTDYVFATVDVYALGSNVENLFLLGSAVTGNGNSGDNGLLGNDLNNVLNGAGGDDLLNGGLGNDTMTGGTGNDSYYLDQVGDVAIEVAGGGIDLIYAAFTYTLTSVFESLTLTASGDGTGNSTNNVITGQGSDNTLSGLTGNDTLAGMGGNDVLLGGEGDDSLDGGTGNDTISGYLGNDSYTVDFASDTIIEAAVAGVDEVFAAVNWTLAANFENLTLLGGNLYGGGSAVDNRITGGSGNNTIDGLSGNDTLYGMGGSDSLYGGQGNDGLDGGDGDDTLDGGGGTNQVYGGLGNDTITADDPTSGVFDGGGGADLLDIAGYSNAILLNMATGANGFGVVIIAGFESLNAGLGNDTVFGTDGDNGITVNGGNDVVFAGLGNDTIVGGDGNDYLDGGEGDNTIFGNLGNDTLVGAATGYNVYFDGGDGYDLVDLSATFANYVVDMVTGVTNYGEFIVNFEALIAGAYNDEITGNAADNQILANGGDDTVHAGDGADLVLGADGFDLLFGEGGGDTLFGQNGNDELDGGAGHDTIYGGSGDDVVVIADGDDGFDTVDGEDGRDVLDANAITYDLGLNMADGSTNVGAIFAGFEVVITGSGGDVVTGTAAAEYILTNGGNDWLDGGLGADTLIGELGDDVYVYTPGDLLVELVNGGNDGVYSDYTLTLAANIENLVMTGVNAINGTGNALANSLTGNDGANTLTGLAGNDSLDGGLGADTLAGGLGNDSFGVDDAADIVVEAGNQGADTVVASIGYTLGSTVENLILTGSANINATGNATNNAVTGNDGNNILDGKAGGDSMSGGLGDDTYYVDNVGDRVYEGDLGGGDIVFSTVTYSSAVQFVETITLTGSAAINAIGNTLDNTLNGNSGANDLNGGLGADTMIGGLGSDTYNVDNAGDVVIEANSTGIDVVNARINFDIGAQYIEVVNLISTGNVNAYGGTLGRAETLNGGTGNNILDGRGGSDTMAGGLGNDTYYVERTTDLVTENAGEGTDLVYTTITYTLTGNVENLTLQGAGNLIGTGNTLDNVLTGNTGANRLLGLDGNDKLDGGAGNDTLTGGLGNDTYVVDSATDSVVELTGEGTDTVQASVSYTLAPTADIETLTLTGTSDINATGNGLVNTLNGNSGNNILDGGAGADTLVGGLGNDTFVVDNAGDVTVDGSTGGTGDTVNASVTYALGASAYIEIFNLTGAGNINATGNNIANTITGNSGSNSLDGGNGADILNGGAGNDTLIGGSSADTFIFGLGSGQDVINDFKSSQNDLINVHAYSGGVVNGGGVVIFQSGANTLIDLGGGNIITVLATTASDPNFLSHIVW